MRPILTLFWIELFLISCGTTNRIVEIKDSIKEIKEIKLVQKHQTVSSEKSGSFVGRKYYNLKVSYHFQQMNKGQAILNAEFQMIHPVSTDQLDSILIFDLDHEKVKLISTANNSSQLMKQEFNVPENLWVAIAHSQEIFYSLYVEKEEIDVRLTASETLQVKEFFNQAIEIHNANSPAIPEGQKKW